MFDFLTAPFANDHVVVPSHVLARLLAALLLGIVVAWVYRRTRTNGEAVASFPATLILLPVLIAMVTQVIGDNVARAFSLVGALSIVRFRTVVRDTQDTAYVIFAVVVGMAVGANDPWVAVIGIAVVTLAALLIMVRGSKTGAFQPTYRLTLRLAAGADVEASAGRLLTERAPQRELLGVESSRERDEIDFTYLIRIAANGDTTPADLVRALQSHPGVLSVELERQGFDK